MPPEHFEDFGLSEEQLGVEQHSFAASLRPTAFDARHIKLWEIETDPTILARENILAEGQTLEQLEDRLQKGEKLFEVLQTKYRIRIVPFHFVREKNQAGQETIFTLVEKIDGLNLSEIASLPSEAKEELETLYCNLAQYYGDMWKQKLPFWGDARSDQFVYGSRPSEAEKHFYITDVDPEFYREGEDEWHTLEAVIGSICRDLIDNEHKFGSEVRFHAARNRLLHLVQDLLAENSNQPMLVEAQGWLTS